MLLYKKYLEILLILFFCTFCRESTKASLLVNKRLNPLTHLSGDMSSPFTHSPSVRAGFPLIVRCRILYAILFNATSKNDGDKWRHGSDGGDG